MWKMQIVATQSDSNSSIVGESSLPSALMNSLTYPNSVERISHQNHAIVGLTVPSVLGEAMDSFDCQPMASIWDSTRFADRVPLPGLSMINAVVDGRFGPNGEQEKTPTYGHFVYPSECTKTAATDNSSGVINSSLQSMNCGYENVPFGTCTTSNMDKGTIPRDVLGRTRVQPAHLAGPIEWMLTEHRGLSCNSPRSSRFRNDFSLSVSRRNSTREQCSEISSSSGLIFLQAMHEILEELAVYALENTGIDENNGANFAFVSCHATGRGHHGQRAYAFQDNINADNVLMFQDNYGMEAARKKPLLALLQSVDDQYSQCLHNIHTVSSAFHSVTELDPNLHARFALPAISLMYKNLRERIITRILPIGGEGEGGLSRCNLVEKQQRWAIQQLSKWEREKKRDRQHPMWRPQRGLPERSVSVLRAWMFQNFLHPYPKDADKHLLALKSGLTRSQVSNWFINARVRLWKPMIEEMYAELNFHNASRRN